MELTFPTQLDRVKAGVLAQTETLNQVAAIYADALEHGGHLRCDDGGIGCKGAGHRLLVQEVKADDGGAGETGRSRRQYRIILQPVRAAVAITSIVWVHTVGAEINPQATIMMNIVAAHRVATHQHPNTITTVKSNLIG